MSSSVRAPPGPFLANVRLFECHARVRMGIMARGLTWEEAIRLADRITESPDAGAWHARVAVAGNGQDYAVMVRQHCTDDWYYPVLRKAPAFRPEI
jgi:hypothetical protein